MPAHAHGHLAKAAESRNMKHLITPDLGSNGKRMGVCLTWETWPPLKYVSVFGKQSCHELK
jgi:hypothetical protein